MYVFKLLPAFVLMGATQAFYFSFTRSRAKCVSDKVDGANSMAPEKAEAVICYHGKNHAVITDNADQYGYLWYTKCSGIGLDCLWIAKGNAWIGEEDGGSDNVAVVLRKNNCRYDSVGRFVQC